MSAPDATGGSPPVLTTDHDRVRLLRLSRPRVRNAMDSVLLAALLEALTEAQDDPGVAALVIAGDGGHFSAGADLREPLDHDGQVRRMDLFAQVYEAVGTCAKPTVAAIAGHCVGGGIEVAAACDVRVADPSASFRFPGAALGLPVGAAKIVGLVGLGTAKDLVLTSRTFDAFEAARVGFVQRLAEPDQAEAVALGVAAQIAAHPLEAVAWLRLQFARFDGLPDRIAAENDALHAYAEAGGDLSVLSAPPPGTHRGRLGGGR